MLFLFASAFAVWLHLFFLLLLLHQGLVDACTMRLPDRGNLAIALLALLRMALLVLLSAAGPEAGTAVLLSAAGPEAGAAVLLSAAGPEAGAGVLTDLAAAGVPTCVSAGESLAGALAVSLPMYLFERLRPGSFGGGDIKFCAAAGLYLGARILLAGCFLGLLLAGGYALLLAIKARMKKRKIADQVFPLGPFLALGLLYTIL